MCFINRNVVTMITSIDVMSGAPGLNSNVEQQSSNTQMQKSPRRQLFRRSKRIQARRATESADSVNNINSVDSVHNVNTVNSGKQVKPSSSWCFLGNANGPLYTSHNAHNIR
jgi:hypothetical protein